MWYVGVDIPDIKWKLVRLKTTFYLGFLPSQKFEI